MIILRRSLGLGLNTFPDSLDESSRMTTKSTLGSSWHLIARSMSRVWGGVEDVKLRFDDEVCSNRYEASTSQPNWGLRAWLELICLSSLWRCWEFWLEWWGWMCWAKAVESLDSRPWRWDQVVIEFEVGWGDWIGPEAKWTRWNPDIFRSLR